jgi:hypothetical protein
MILEGLTTLLGIALGAGIAFIGIWLGSRSR